MTEKNHVLMTEVVTGVCPTCNLKTLLVGFDKIFYRCTTCGNDLEQKKNGVIKYINANKNTRIHMFDHTHMNGQEKE
jgi:tRNA(Ile2) C34 agmatinyltransferase TiaS